MSGGIDLKHYRYTWLLLSLLLLAMATPFINSNTGADLMDLSAPLVMIAAVYAAGRRRRDFYIALALAIPTVLVGVVLQIGASIAARVVCETISIAFLGFIIWSILGGVLSSKQVTLDTINGAICAYLMIGLTFAATYALLEEIDPGSLRFAEAFGTENLRLLEEIRFFRLIYYSFVTITTTGYGDILAVTPAARLFSMLEAIIGQFYIAILVARLVGVHLVQSMKAEL
jgi:hypothetical protein